MSEKKIAKKSKFGIYFLTVYVPEILKIFSTLKSKLTHFLTYFQKIDHFWNLQALVILMGSMVLFYTALDLKKN